MLRFLASSINPRVNFDLKKPWYNLVETPDSDVKQLTAQGYQLSLGHSFTSLSCQHCGMTTEVLEQNEGS